MRGEKAPALWRALKRRALELRANPRLLPQSSLGKAVNYFLNEYTAVVGYLRDGRYEIDNNNVENDVRPSAVGRRRWLFIGHPDAGWRSAVIYSVLGTCKLHKINEWSYLSWALPRLAGATNHTATRFTPQSFAQLPR